MSEERRCERLVARFEEVVAKVDLVEQALVDDH